MNRLAPLVLALLLALPSPAHAITSTALNGAVDVDPGGYVLYTVRVPPILPGKPRVTADLKVTGGARNDIRVLVFTQDQFREFEQDKPATPLFESRKLSTLQLDVPLPGAGTYVIVFSNTFSTVSTKTVTGRLGLTWDPPFAAILAGVGAVALVVWLKTRRARNDEEPEQLAKSA
jgi:hypothetical protein